MFYHNNAKLPCSYSYLLTLPKYRGTYGELQETPVLWRYVLQGVFVAQKDDALCLLSTDTVGGGI